MKIAASLFPLLFAGLFCAVPAHAGKTLDAIKSRNQLVCGVSTGLQGFSATNAKGIWTGLDVDTCRAVAAAVLGDADKVKYVPLNPQQRFAAVQSGEIDILARNTTWTMTRDSSLGLVFVGANFYDGQGFMVSAKGKIKSLRDLKGATVCVGSGTITEKNLADFSRAGNMNIKPVVFEQTEAVIAAYLSGRCHAYINDRSGLASVRAKEARNPADHVILPDVITKEPLGPSIRRGDDEFFQVVRWVMSAMVEAEEYGITRSNLEQVRKTAVHPGIGRLLGTTEDMGKLIGLDKEWAARVIAAVGNYGEVFERNFGRESSINLDRGLNQLWNKGGVMYAPPIR